MPQSTCTALTGSRDKGPSCHTLFLPQRYANYAQIQEDFTGPFFLPFRFPWSLPGCGVVNIPHLGITVYPTSLRLRPLLILSHASAEKDGYACCLC